MGGARRPKPRPYARRRRPAGEPGLLEKVDYAVNRAGLKHVYLTTNAILINRNDTYKKID